MALNNKLGFIGASTDTPVPGVVGSGPSTNATWANLIAGTTTTDSALADAGYIEFPGVARDGTTAITCRIPVVKA